MSDEKKEKTDNGLAAVVRKIREDLDKVIHTLEVQFGIDVDKDGKIGKSGRVALSFLLVLALTLSVGAATKWNLRNDADTADIVNIDDSGNMTLTGGVTATGAIDAGTMTATSFTKDGSVVTSENAAVSIAVTGSEVRRAVLTVTSMPVPIPFAGTATNHIGGVKIATFPQGRILIHGVTASGLNIATNATLVIAKGGDIALGSTAIATIDDNAAALAGTVIDMMAAASIDPISNTNFYGGALAASAQFDGTTTAVPIYLNVQIDDADLAATTTNNVSGTVIIHYTDLGDY